MASFYTVTESINNYVKNTEGKGKAKKLTIFGKGIMAGAMIAMGAAASSVAAHNISNVGIARLISGMVFPVGLMMVILLGAELFTGDCMMLVGVTRKVISPLKCLEVLALVYIGNFVGSLLMAVLMYFSGQFDYTSGLLGAYTIKIALGKANISFGAGVASGILCNILVCAAVLMAMCAKDVIGKVMVSFFVILAFVTSGFEHCVANMYYIAAGIIAKLNPEYVEVAKSTYGYMDSQLATLNIKNFLVTNLVPVTIGNIIGGALLFGIPVYYLSNAKANNTNEEIQEDNNYAASNIRRIAGNGR